MERRCRLADAVGRVEACAEERCPFWEPGGAVLDARCAFEQLDLTGRAALAEELLRVRSLLDRAPTVEDARRVRREFYGLLNDTGPD